MQQPDLIPPRTIRAPYSPAILAGRSVVIDSDIMRACRQRMRTPQKMKVSEWAELKRVVPEGAHEGPWRSELAPHTVKIMDTYGQPWVREVWFCGVEQSGKTNTMINCMGWAIDCDPGNIFYLMPTESASNQIVGTKIKPTLQRSPGLSKYLSGRQDDTTMSRIAMRHGVTLFPAHANSPTSMATFAAKHCFGDEVDKYPPMAGREADPITLLKKRNRNYRGRFKRFFSSTPAGAYIYKGMQACHQVWEFRLRCPECGDYIKMDVDHLVIPENATADNVDRLGVQYACNGCGTLWDDHDRESAIRNGRWQCVKGEDVARPSKVGFHHRSWECLDIPLTEIAAAWLKTKSGQVSARIAWANGYEAEDYTREAAEVLDVDQILARREDYAERVPMEAGYLTAGVDIQGDRIEVEVVAWGLDHENWSIDYQVLPGDTSMPGVWKDLDEYLKTTWTHATGAELRIMATCVDSGFRTPEVYQFVKDKLRRRIIAVKGASKSGQPLINGPSRQKHGNIRVALLTIGTDTAKDQLFEHLAVDEPGPCFCHFPERYAKSYFDQFAAEVCEERIVSGRTIREWKKISGNARNEAIDLRVYNMAAYTWRNPNMPKIMAELQQRAEQRKEQEEKQNIRPKSRKKSFVQGWKK